MTNQRQAPAQRQPEPENYPAISELRKPEVIEQIRRALPPGTDVERYVRGVLTTIANGNETLKKCSGQSIFQAILTAAQLGLDVDAKGHAYPVPFWNKARGCYEAQLMPGWKGYVFKARESKQVKAIWIEVVYKGDTFRVIKGTNPSIQHEPNVSSAEYGKDEAITHFYAAVKLASGEMEFEVMNRAQVDEIRKGVDSRSDNGSKFWRDHYGQMGRKCPMRRLAGRLQLPEIEAVVAADDKFAGYEAPAAAPFDEAKAKKEIQACSKKLGWKAKDFTQYLETAFAKKTWDELSENEKRVAHEYFLRRAAEKEEAK